MPITGRYGSRMFFSRFHNAWLTVSEALVPCPPANRPADASCRSLVGMGAECSSRVSTMHGSLHFSNTGYGSRMLFRYVHNAWLTVSEASVQCPPANRPAGAARRSLVGMGANYSSRASTMHGQLYRKQWRSARRLPGRSMLYANHWSVWDQNVRLPFPQCMDRCNFR